MIRVGIDARPLQNENRFRGIGYYTYNLIRNIGKIDSENEYVLFTIKNADRVNLNISNNNFQEYAIYRPQSPTRLAKHLWWLWDRLLLPKALSNSQIDLFHATDNRGVPISHTCKVIATIYDLIPVLFPKHYFNSFKALDLRYNYYRQLKAARKSAMIITISECSKRDIIRILHVPEEKIKVIYLAVDERFRPIKNKRILERVKAKYNVNRPFALYIGGFDYRKNVERLIRSFYLFSQQSTEDIQLVIGGALGSEMALKLKQLISSLNLREKIILPGFIADADLPVIYNTAEFFIFPSLYEGFGLPVLEAMACGTPVICSNTSSLPEVAGDAAILVNPYDEEEIAQTMKRVLTDPDLREKMKRKGLERVKLFSWEQTAKETLKVYQQVAWG